MDGRRFTCNAENVWSSEPGDLEPWWDVDFGSPKQVGAILAVLGDDSLEFRNAPADFHWEQSADGVLWESIPGAEIKGETRMYRILRFTEPIVTQRLRLKISRIHGDHATIREVEFFSEPSADIQFPPWIAAVSTVDRRESHDKLTFGREFIPLARQCEGFEDVPAQHVFLEDFDEQFCSIEPKPLCAFLSGNLTDWCQKDRARWAGVMEVMKEKQTPIWASCGGAQGLAILSEHGLEQPWDCPHCRNPRNPKTPIYTHIGDTDSRPCGDYSCCIHEKGEVLVRKLRSDKAFDGLEGEFPVMESHCGQIAYVPKGWEQLIGAGSSAKTEMQCVRMIDVPIYAAQFHIEMEGSKETSERIMSNFLKIATEWRKKQ